MGKEGRETSFEGERGVFGKVWEIGMGWINMILRGGGDIQYILD